MLLAIGTIQICQVGSMSLAVVPTQPILWNELLQWYTGVLTLMKLSTTTGYHATINSDVPVAVLHQIVQVMTNNMHMVRDTRTILYINVKSFDKVLMVLNRMKQSKCVGTKVQVIAEVLWTKRLM